MRGRFITFEGGEGAGKSTQIERLRAFLESGGQRVRVTREPGGSEKAEGIRSVLLSGRAKRFGPFAEALLFYAARHDHLEAVIRPSLDAGIHVLCDRFADSTRAYQGALGNVDPAILRSLDRVIVGTTQPDLTFVLDLPAEMGLARARARGGGAGEADRFEAEDLTFHKRLRDAYRTIALENPDRCVLIDAVADAAIVEKRIRAALRARLPDLDEAREPVDVA